MRGCCSFLFPNRKTRFAKNWTSSNTVVMRDKFSTGICGAKFSANWIRTDQQRSMSNFKGGICFQDTLPLLGLACLLGTIEHMSVKGGETQTEMSGAETSDRDRPTDRGERHVPPSLGLCSLPLCVGKRHALDSSISAPRARALNVNACSQWEYKPIQ